MAIRNDQHQDRTNRFDSGGKRGRTRRSEDPYILEESRPEPAICSSCRAVFRNKRWYLPETQEVAPGEAHEVVCPACQKIRENYPEGIVTLRGNYLWKHEEEIRNILTNTEGTAMAKNPLERIMRIAQEGDALVVETTEEKLAEHIGRALHRAHQGKLDVTWSDNHALCRVTWERGE